VAWAPLVDLLPALFRATTTITARTTTAAAIISHRHRFWGGAGAASGTGTGPGAGSTAGAGATSATLKSNGGFSTFLTYLSNQTTAGLCLQDADLLLLLNTETESTSGPEPQNRSGHSFSRNLWAGK
jgi:hypothetical protein